MNLFPEVTSQLREHCGEHGGILQHCINNPMFMPILEEIKTNVVDMVERSSDPVFTIVVVCAHGRHRSVAVARSLHYILNSYGYQCPEPSHLGDWSKLCSKCEQCSTTRFSRTKQEALERALALYDLL